MSRLTVFSAVVMGSVFSHLGGVEPQITIATIFGSVVSLSGHWYGNQRQ
jgi:hypothetical protein